MILVTGANGRPGRAIIHTLSSKGAQVRAFVHKAEQIEEIMSVGATEAVAGDMMDQKAIKDAFAGVSAIYHICSAINPNEFEIGKIMIEAAREAKVEQFVYHSVLHSVLQDMPHHQKKLMVEEFLINSGVPYTIVQPAVFMQNILDSWNVLKEEGIFRQKFFTSEETRMCMLDLEDLAEAASIILMNPGHTGVTYELSGPENLSFSDMTETLKRNLGREIKVETPTDEMFLAQLRKFGADDYRANTLLKMFQHYNEYGFIGNPNVLTWLLGRKPNEFSAFVLRMLAEEK